MRIAIAYDAGKIGESFVNADLFAVYDYENFDPSQCTKRLLDSSGHHGSAAMAEFMHEHKVDIVLAGRMESEEHKLLLSHSILPVVGYSGDADTAADLLITGEIVIDGMGAEVREDGLHGGFIEVNSCGDCGGGCCGGDDYGEGGSCGCGCGGGCCGG